MARNIDRDRAAVDRERVVLAPEDRRDRPARIAVEEREVEERVEARPRERERTTYREYEERPAYREYREPEPRDWQVEMPKAYPLDADRIHWGAVWGGFLAMITAGFLLGLLGLAVGLSAAEAEPVTGLNGTLGTLGFQNLAGFAPTTALWGAISTLLAFFIGGWVAGRAAAVYSRRWGAWNGAMVFMLVLPLSLLFATGGVGAMLGLSGAFGAGVGPGATGALAPTLTGTAWATLIAVVAILAVSAIGGAVGARRHLPLERVTGEVEPRGGGRRDR